jgi:hypothetical protein
VRVCLRVCVGGFLFWNSCLVGNLFCYFCCNERGSSTLKRAYKSFGKNHEENYKMMQSRHGLDRTNTPNDTQRYRKDPLECDVFLFKVVLIPLCITSNSFIFCTKIIKPLLTRVAFIELSNDVSQFKIFLISLLQSSRQFLACRHRPLTRPWIIVPPPMICFG